MTGWRAAAIAAAGVGCCCAAACAQPFEPTWESLEKWECPGWYLDAKFGVFIHWGVYSVPAFGNEWYPRNMYREGSAEFKHHREAFGDQKEFGYKDFIPRFSAEHFDAAAWAALFEQAGARYVVPVAEHHDGFAMYDCSGTDWDAAARGPTRDVIAELSEAVRARDMKFCVSSHRAHNWNYYTFDDRFDTADPANAGLYGERHAPGVPASEAFRDEWLRRCEELVDKFQPDLFWFDFGFNAPEYEEYRRRFAAYYYNRAAEWGKPAVINYKGGAFPAGAAVLDIERGKLDHVREYFWQTDTSVCYRAWGYIENHDYKPVDVIIHDLVDIVSKNGCLLLNICPRPDGTIPDHQQEMLREIGAWLRVNGEAVYGTRPWLVYGEGPTGVPGAFNERGQAAYTAQDIRFTRSKDGAAVYATVLGDPGPELVIHSLLAHGTQPGANVELLGNGAVAYRVDEKGRFVISLPGERPSGHAMSLKFTGFDLGVNPAGAFVRPGVITLDAAHATLEGDHLRTEEKLGGSPNIGFWDSPGERVHWLVRAPEAGTYAVRARVAAANGATTLRFGGEGWAVQAEAPQTEGWDKPVYVEFPSVELGAGVHHVVLSPADADAWRAVNVWSVELARTQ